MAVEVGSAYVSILPSMRGFSSALNSGIAKDIDSSGQSAGKSFGSSLVGGLSTVVKGASIGATIFGGLALKSGLDRLTTIQNATTSLTTIMGDAGKAAALMGEIKKTVQGTPFNLDQFADAGKNLVAMNIAGEKVPGILTAIGNAAATSGKGAEGVQSLVDVFGKMAAQGQVSLDQVWSISSTGVPALQILANHFGETTAGMKKLISTGAVPATEAIDALTNGIMNGSDGAAGATIAFGGAMEGLRQTFTGAFGGMKAAVARFGAAVLGPFMPLMTNAFTGAGTFLDTIAKRVTPVMERAAVAVGSLLAGITGQQYAGVGAPLDSWVTKGEAVRATVVRIKDGVVGLYQLLVNGDFTSAFSTAFGVHEDAPIVGFLLSIHDAVSTFVADLRAIDFSSFTTALSGAQTTFQGVGQTLTTVKDNASTLKPAVANLGSAMSDAAGAGGVVLSNLLGLLSGTLSFFADHTTLATAAILALTAGMVASGPISQAYHLAYAVRTPLMVIQTIATWSQTGATKALTAALLQQTGAQAANNTATKLGVIGQVAAKLGIITTAAATEGATAATWSWNTALLANPITWIVVGIAALVAGLVLFFTKTETGRKIVSAAWSGIKNVVGGVVSWFSSHVLPVLSAVWGGIVTGAKWLWGVLGPIFGFIGDHWRVIISVMLGPIGVLIAYWKQLAGAAQWMWRSVLSPVFSAIGSAFQAVGSVVMAVWNGFLSPVFQLVGAIVAWLWGNILSIVFAAIKLEWQAVATAVQLAWNNILKPVFTAVGDAATWLWDNVLSPVFGWISDGWNLLLLGIQTVWTTVLKPVFDAVGVALSFLWNSVISPVLGWIGTAWGGLMTGIKAVWDTVLAPIFGDGGVISTAVTAVKSAFETVIDGVKTAWDKLIDIAKAPVKFVVNTVINDVFIAGFNKLAGIFGTDQMSPIKLPDGFATGGPVRGPGTGTSDSIPAMLSNGEYVVPADKTAMYRPHLEAMRSGQFPRYYADGGFVTPMFNVVKAQFPDANVNSGYRAGSNDYHGRGQAIDLGKKGVAGGNGNSYLAAMNEWIYDKFGRNTAELIYDGLGDTRSDIKNGAAHVYDSVTTAAHRNHVHWALNDLAALQGAGGLPQTGNGSSGGSVLDFLGGLNPIAWLKGKVTGAMGALGSSGFAKMIGGAPGHLLKLVTDKFSSIFGAGSTASSGTGLDAWINQAIIRTGVNAGWMSGLRTLIGRESGGNPKAQNNSDSNAAKGTPSKGLMQLIGPTFEAYRDKALSDDIFDPLANIVAGIRYILARYGGIENVQQANPDLPPKGYDSGGYLQPGYTKVFNGTGKPEPVFTSQQWRVLAASSPSQQAAQTSAAPQVDVKVFLGTTELTDIVDTRITTREQQSALNARAMGVSN